MYLKCLYTNEIDSRTLNLLPFDSIWLLCQDEKDDTTQKPFIVLTQTIIIFDFDNDNCIHAHKPQWHVKA